MIKLGYAGSRPPQLRRRLTIGGSGVLMAAVLVSVGYVAAASRSQQAHAAAVAETRTQLASPHVAGEVVVGYKPSVSDAAKTAHIARHAGRLRQRNSRINADVVTIAPGDETATLEDLKTSPDVAFAEPDFIRHSLAIAPNDPGYAQQWGYKNAAFDTAWNITTGAGAPLIGQIDSGIDLTHPDLAANIAPGGYNTVTGTTDPSDDLGHGSSTFGIIAEVEGNGIGGVGGCWSCKVLPVKVLDNTGAGSASQVAAGITYLVDHGVKIINASLGGANSSTAEANAVAYAVSKGVIFISAVCEDQATNPAVIYPASYPGVIGVGALSANNTLEPWSCYGPYVKISAPSTTYTATYKHGYNASFQGTSAAAPFVTAAAALLWAAHPTATRDQVITALLSGSDPCCSNTAGGKLNVAKAMAALASAVPSIKKGDLNGDGAVNVFDLSILLSKWGTADAKADINGDGTVNVFDLSILLAGWTG